MVELGSFEKRVVEKLTDEQLVAYGVVKTARNRRTEKVNELINRNAQVVDGEVEYFLKPKEQAERDQLEKEVVALENFMIGFRSALEGSKGYVVLGDGERVAFCELQAEDKTVVKSLREQIAQLRDQLEI
jgi:hypothetical protein